MTKNRARMNAPRMDPMPGLKGRAKLIDRITCQQRWIEWCEEGISYEGENGPAIRQADFSELRSLETLLRIMPPGRTR